MSELEDLTHPAPGLYEQLITLRFEQKLKELSQLGWHPVSDAVGPESVPHLLARHVSHTVRRVLQNLPVEDRVYAANHILESISTLNGAQEWVDLVADGPRQLLAITQQEAPGVFAVRPGIPLSDTALLTNSPEDPSLGFELRAELATADRVDLLCAFVKWHGLRVIERSLRAARERGVPIRVLTTTYMGATERRALDRLVEDFHAEVKVNYETRSTRLHAKAWLFQRNSGYHTAYVGSSNLSKAALLDGLEWNVRLSSVATPEVMRKFEATFESYWNDPSFETYDAGFAHRFESSMLSAGRCAKCWRTTSRTPSTCPSPSSGRPETGVFRWPCTPPTPVKRSFPLSASPTSGASCRATSGKECRWCESVKTDALLITLEKDEKDFSPQTRYRDFALSETRFHWESQNQTSETSPTGLRYQRHVAQGSQVLLFVRRYKTTDIGGAQPWMLLGPAEYERHEGSKPMAVTWKVRHPIPADVLSYAKAVAAG
ncbi:hypothetical protein SHIRM173S_05335 [Streptomyces hirsutus]